MSNESTPRDPGAYPRYDGSSPAPMPGAPGRTPYGPPAQTTDATGSAWPGSPAGPGSVPGEGVPGYGPSGYSGPASSAAGAAAYSGAGYAGTRDAGSTVTGATVATGAPTLTAPTVAPGGPTPPPRRTRRGRGFASLATVAVLAAGVGGGTAYGLERTWGAGGGSAPAPTVTRVVQGNSSAPDWTATADAVQHSVVSITVAGRQGQSEGSGVVWDDKGNVVTNNHVVSALGSGAAIQVAEGDKVFRATVVGTDPSTDLAVIRVTNPTSDLHPIALATSAPTVGEPVMAAGNPLGLSDTVTTGIVSALNRPVVTQAESGSTGSLRGADTASSTVVTNAIQTSAPINPGNSGGALVNANGELIGINSSIASLSSGSSSGQSGSIGIGFAIPVAQVKSITSQLLDGGTARHPVLGVSARDGAVTVGGSDELGAELASVTSGGPAASAGLQTGDVVVGIGDTSVVSAESLVAQVRSLAVGQQVEIRYVRGGEEKKASVTLGGA